MIVAYAFCTRDQEQALKNAQWLNDLGGCHGHQIVCCYDPRCSSAIVELVGAELRKAFDKVWRIQADSGVDGWPEGANYMFTLCATWLQSKPEWPYFFWLEPDAIPIAEGWLDKLEAEYKRAGKPFMGDKVQVGDIPLHMSGVGIYQNPIYKLAGEAYRAHETAWDMAAKDQIIPNAHFTELIEHAWKHPTFHYLSELGTQIAPQTLLFHSSKDGSLIDLLRQKRGGKQEAEASIASARPIQPKEPDKPGSPSPLTYDIFIRTYPGDYEWLAYSVLSIHKFCTGFRKIWVVSTGPQPDTVRGVEWKVMQDETEDGYLAQQITKLYADVHTDYQADYILHVDSDIVFTRPTTPQDFFLDGKMIWYYTDYREIETPWQPVTQKFMCCTVGSEYMRRLPMMVPRWLYPRLREFCHKQHGMVISDYIKMQPMREFSEFNALGAYASLKYPENFEWIDTTKGMPEPFAKQFHSWSGLTPAIKSEIEKILGEGEGQIPGRIKVLKDDVWVLEGDLISQWVEQEGRLDHDQNLLPDILKHIRPGASVVDVGAFIGDHTVAYSKAVGPAGMVYAYEPNPLAFQCLAHNTGQMKNVSRYQLGLSDKAETVPLSGNNGNHGGAYVGTHMKIGDVKMTTLDDEMPWGADFIKIDVEGYELKVLQGAADMIEKCMPRMVIEINEEALRRQGVDRGEIFYWLEKRGYDWEIMQENACWNDPLYDILCVPAGVHHPVGVVKAETNSDRTGSEVNVVCPTEPPPQVALSKETLKGYVKALADFAGQSVKNRMLVRQRLALSGLAHKTPKKNK